MLDQEVLDVELKATKAEEEEDTRLKEVKADAKTNTITVKVVPEETKTNALKVQLVDIPENSQIKSEDGIKFEKDSTPSVDRNIEIPSTPGIYDFELQSDGKTKTVTVEVQNCTIATIKSVTEIPDSELSRLNETVASDMKRATDIWGSTAGSDTTVDKTLNLSLNVNKLHSSTAKGDNGVSLSGDLVAAKISIDPEHPYKFYDNDEDLVAYNKTTGEVLPTVTAEKGKSYYVYVDSDYKSSNILLVNTHTTADMIEENEDKATVVINNNGILGNTQYKGANLGVIIVEDSKVTSEDLKANQSKSTNQVASASLDNNLRNTINIYAKSELLKSYKIDNNEGKWFGIHFEVVTNNYKAKDVTVLNNSDTNSVLISTDFSTNDKIKDNIKDPGTEAIVWVKVPDFTTMNDYKKTYTIEFKYSKDEKEETATYTINVYNAGYTYVKSIEPADEYTKNLISEGYAISDDEIKTIREVSMSNQYKNFIQEIKLDTVVKAADERTIVRNVKGVQIKETGKIIKLKITYNMPVELIRYGTNEYDWSIDKNNGVNNDGNNVENDIYSEYVYFNIDSLSSGISRYLYNAYGLKNNTGYEGETNSIPRSQYDNKSYVTIKSNDISEITNNIKNWAIGGYDAIEISEKDAAMTVADIKGITAAPTKDLETQLKAATVATSTNTNISTSSSGNLVINGKEGNWVLCYAKIPQSLISKVSISDSKSSIYVDKVNASALFGVTTVLEDTNKNYDIVPMWFNLNDMGFDATKEGGQQLTTIVKFELTNSKTGATEYVDSPVTIKITANS